MLFKLSISLLSFVGCCVLYGWWFSRSRDAADAMESPPAPWTYGMILFLMFLGTIGAILGLIWGA